MIVTPYSPLPQVSDEVRLALRAAELYHLEGATRAEIAAKLGVSRPTAGRLIAHAKAHGMVRVEIGVTNAWHSAVHTPLEHALEARFGLVEAVVLGESGGDESPGDQALGHAAAALLVRRLRRTDTLGYTWGPETVALAKAIRARTARCAAVVQLNGAMTSAEYRTGADYILGRCATLLQARPVSLPAPLYADVGVLTADYLVSQALSIGTAADIMVFGTGPVGPASTLCTGGYLDAAALDELRAAEAVGEIGGRFFRIDGSQVGGALSARTIGVSLAAVRDCRTSVLVSGGVAKHEAVLGALNGGLAKVLVTDVECARWLSAQPR
ncbi:sugar-binding transcriptional regulator [Nocardia arthritidis]|uniref:Sugar-binding transcriptional regulator n=1 Tax=Nocardia arthritidis TaxID=228602 RepID=A0A6G9YDD9_9NOCA|nr:sugar-binding transcriptional regulator [Nocardia arthritidis]